MRKGSPDLQTLVIGVRDDSFAGDPRYCSLRDRKGTPVGYDLGLPQGRSPLAEKIAYLCSGSSPPDVKKGEAHMGDEDEDSGRRRTKAKTKAI